MSDSPHRSGWPFRREWLYQENVRGHKFRIKCDLNEAAYRALALRAENTKTTMSAIARWGVCLFVSGQLDKMAIVSSLNALYKVPTGYCLTPKIT